MEILEWKFWSGVGSKMGLLDTNFHLELSIVFIE